MCQAAINRHVETVVPRRQRAASVLLAGVPQRQMFTFKRQSLLAAIVIMTGAKEEVRGRYYRAANSAEGGGQGGWIYQQNIGPLTREATVCFLFSTGFATLLFFLKHDHNHSQL